MNNNGPNLIGKYFLYLRTSITIIACLYAFVLLCFWISPYVSIVFNVAQAFASIGVVFYGSLILLSISFIVSLWFLCVAFNIKRNGSDNLLNKVRYIDTGIFFSLLLDVLLSFIALLGINNVNPDDSIIAFFAILSIALISIKAILQIK